MTDEKIYTLQEAAAACGVSLPTLHRRRDALLAAGAVKTSKRWEIPHSALVSVGLNPSWTVEAEQATEEPQEPHQAAIDVPPEQPPTNELRAAQDRVRRLESENLILRSQLDNWQLLARERLDALNDIRVAFRALTMSRPQQELEPDRTIKESVQVRSDEQPAPEHRSWWSRLTS